jgi:putative transposase
MRCPWRQGRALPGHRQAFNFITAAAKTWRKLKGENQLPKVIQGVKFRDGIEVSVPTSHSAA